jgi:hypothetical protein
VPSIEISINSQKLTVDGTAVTPQYPAHIPHAYVVKATLEKGCINIKANKPHLKHVKDDEYQLTFE